MNVITADRGGPVPLWCAAASLGACAWDKTHRVGQSAGSEPASLPARQSHRCIQPCIVPAQDQGSRRCQSLDNQSKTENTSRVQDAPAGWKPLVKTGHLKHDATPSFPSWTLLLLLQSQRWVNALFFSFPTSIHPSMIHPCRQGWHLYMSLDAFFFLICSDLLPFTHSFIHSSLH